MRRRGNAAGGASLFRLRSAVVAAIILIALGLAVLTLLAGWRGPVYALAGATVVLGGLLLGAAGAWAAWHSRLRPWLVRELIHISGRRILRTLPPQEVLAELLTEIYGEHPANEHVVRGVLGGGGSRLNGNDFVVSRNTRVLYELRDEVPGTYNLTSSVLFTLTQPIHDPRLVIFATSSGDLRNVLTAGSRRPLFDCWFLPDTELFHESVDRTFETIGVGMTYMDPDGHQHTVAVQDVQPRYVPFEEWEDFLSFFTGPIGTIPRQDPRRYLSRLRIFEADLTTLAQQGRELSAVTSVTLRTSILQRSDDGFCFWSAPYPCYVENVSFDLRDFSGDPDADREFQVVPFFMHPEAAPIPWTMLPGRISVDVGSWALPGHGLALLWRSDPPPDQ